MQLLSFKRIFLKLRPVLRWIFRLRGSPKAVAGGFGLGIFIAFTPTVGVQVVLAFAIATLLNLNRVAAVLPVWITNPVTIPFIFTFNYWLGSLIWPGPRVGDVYRRMLKTAADMATLDIWEIRAQIEAFVFLGKEIIIPLVIGSVFVGGCAGYLGYFALLKLFAWFSLRREVKRRKMPKKI
jgi:uncharacterized protein (DUF2062 family)